MNEAQQEFRERLLSVEKASPTEKYRKEMAALHERRLSPAQRAILALVTISALAAAVFMGWLAAIPPRHLPMLSRFGLGFWAICSLVASVLASGVAKRGVMRRKIDPNRIVAFIYVSLVVFAITMLALMGQVPDAGDRIIMGSVALFVFGIGSVFLITNRLEQMELRTREKLLEIELELHRFTHEARTTAR
jgi:uncharacterized membrane protein (DUF441 family)